MNNRLSKSSRNPFRWIFIGLGMVTPVYGQIAESQYEVPQGLVQGGAFIDLFQPVPLVGKLRSDVWGDDNVIPRDVLNGIEDDEYSYWGGNIVIGEDGKNHMFVCRWPENHVRGDKSGHFTWWDSTVVHAVSENPLGPYTVVEEIGKGHNPEAYQVADGTWYIGVMGPWAYRADSLNGTWEKIPATFDDPDLKGYLIENRTYAPRDDGSVLMMNKCGHLFVSEKGNEDFKQLSDKSVYPSLTGDFHLEDPIFWKDEIQYHLIVNDCRGRVAYYLRSPDGLNWKWTPGHAYNLDVMTHTDGTSEKWFKLERAKVRQDQYGRVTHMNFAAIDCPKDQDVANDNHSSKNVVLPLTVPRRMVILNKEPINEDTLQIKVKILAEEGFDPHKDINLKSLKFGAPEEVDFGRGCVAVDARKSGKDAIVTFDGSGNGITKDNFAAKMIGRMKDGELAFGYASLPK